MQMTTEEELESAKKLIRDLSRIIHDMVTSNQSAWIEWQHGKGAEAAMIWVQNGLIGPGHIPDEDDPWGKDAQAWFNANCANPLPQCYCGRPSSIGSNEYGACCHAHLKDTEEKIQKKNINDE